MGREPRSLPWVTPAKYVGPLMVIVVLAAGVLLSLFVIRDSFDEAIITLLFSLCLLLVGIADLLGELIMGTARKAQPPDA